MVGGPLYLVHAYQGAVGFETLPHLCHALSLIWSSQPQHLIQTSPAFGLGWAKPENRNFGSFVFASPGSKNRIGASSHQPKPTAPTKPVTFPSPGRLPDQRAESPSGFFDLGLNYTHACAHHTVFLADRTQGKLKATSQKNQARETTCGTTCYFYLWGCILQNVC